MKTVRLCLGVALVLVAHARDAVADRPGTARVRFGEHVYDIPASYGSIGEGGMDTPRGSKAFMFKVLMPDLAPHTAINDTQFRQTGWHDQIGGLFDYVPGRKVLIGKDMLAVGLTDRFMDASRFRTTPHGFRVYTPSVKPDSDLRTKTLPDGQILVLRCMQPGQKYLIYPSCTAIQSWEEFTLTYSFSLKYADQADAIDRKIKRMMLSFRER